MKPMSAAAIKERESGFEYWQDNCVPGCGSGFKDGFDTGYYIARKEAEVLVKALEDIAKPTYGTELCNSDEQNNEILARHHFSNQTVARCALNSYRGEDEAK